MGQRTIKGYYLVDKQFQTQYLSDLRDVNRSVLRVEFITLTVLFFKWKKKKISELWI